MRLADTSIWIEWLLGTPTAGGFRSEFRDPEAMIVPTMVELELEKWFLREQADDLLRRETALFVGVCRRVPLDTTTALLAARFCHEHKLATADAVIYATAVLHGAELLTCDAHFRDLPKVRFVAKARH